MAYQSPLGYNFKLEASISAAKELQTKEMPENNNLGVNVSRLDKFGQFERRNSGGKCLNNSGWQRQNWKSPNSRHSLQNESVDISQYYHPSMLEDPWKEFEEGRPS